MKNDWTLFVGDDNILRPGSIAKLKKYIMDHDWVGGGLQTRVKDANKDYWAYCANWRLKARIYEGERPVIGTPYMFRTDLLKAAGYDAACTVSDDSDMEKRLQTLTEKKYGYSNIICLEIGKTGYDETVKRFLMYGKSDAQYWKKYSPDWKPKRKWKSLCHPIVDELIDPLRSVKPLVAKIRVFPYFLFVTIVRYVGWFKESRLENKAKG